MQLCQETVSRSGDVTPNHKAARRHRPGARKPSIRDVNVAQLADVADALLADGRGDLAQRLVEVLYYCAERQIDNDNVIALSDRRRSPGSRTA
jgi:hypothetical protein